MDFIGKGCVNHLKECVKKDTLLFIQNGNLNRFKNVLLPLLEKTHVIYYTEISANPKHEEIQKAQNILQDNKYDTIVAFGGGSVIDFAKAFRFYNNNHVPLVAVPTTAGTGSETTQFAVVYVNGVKTSLDDISILPDVAIVDSQFIENAPQYLKASCAMDAYCQAIESYWAKKATDESKKYALQAIELCRKYLLEAVVTNHTEANEKMSLAAHLAGKAINISRTTAAHALSYKVTSKYGIPHGHAVALSIAGLFEQNIEALSCEEQNALFYAMQINKADIRSYFHKLMSEIGLEYNLEKLGITAVDEIVDSVNMQRLSNNPKNLSRENLIRILK